MSPLCLHDPRGVWAPPCRKDRGATEGCPPTAPPDGLPPGLMAGPAAQAASPLGASHGGPTMSCAPHCSVPSATGHGAFPFLCTPPFLNLLIKPLKRPELSRKKYSVSPEPGGQAGDDSGRHSPPEGPQLREQGGWRAPETRGWSHRLPRFRLPAARPTRWPQGAGRGPRFLSGKCPQSSAPARAAPDSNAPTGCPFACQPRPRRRWGDFTGRGQLLGNSHGKGTVVAAPRRGLGRRERTPLGPRSPL